MRPAASRWRHIAHARLRVASGANLPDTTSLVRESHLRLARRLAEARQLKRLAIDQDLPRPLLKFVG